MAQSPKMENEQEKIDIRKSRKEKKDQLEKFSSLRNRERRVKNAQ